MLFSDKVNFILTSDTQPLCRGTHAVIRWFSGEFDWIGLEATVSLLSMMAIMAIKHLSLGGSRWLKIIKKRKIRSVEEICMCLSLIPAVYQCCVQLNGFTLHHHCIFHVLFVTFLSVCAQWDCS